MKYFFGIIVLVSLVGAFVTMAGCGNSISQTTSKNASFTTTITSTSSPTWTNFNGVNSASSESINGLSLSVSLDSTQYQPGQDIRIAIDEQNTLSTENKVPASNNWAYTNLALGQCGTNSAIYGIAIFQGNHTAADISSLTQLSLYDYSFIAPCPPPIPVAAYDFKPLSDVITSQYSTSEAFAEMNVRGYWTGSSLSVTRHTFVPGVYTVVGGDEWGTLVVVHFTVINTTTTTQENQQPIEVISALGPLQPINPGGPIVEVTLKNIAIEPVIYLTAVFTGLGPHDFNFDFAVTASNPLLSNTTISDKITLIGGGFSNNVSYPLTIAGTLQNGVTFTYTKQVKIVEPPNQ